MKILEGLGWNEVVADDKGGEVIVRVWKWYVREAMRVLGVTIVDILLTLYSIVDVFFSTNSVSNF